METLVLNSNNQGNIDSSIRNSIRYSLVNKMMEENFNKWLAQTSTLSLIQKLIEDCKKPNISLVCFLNFYFF